MLSCDLVQIEGIVKQLATAGEHEKISVVISLLINDFTYSPQATHRKVLLRQLCFMLLVLTGSDLLRSVVL